MEETAAAAVVVGDTRAEAVILEEEVDIPEVVDTQEAVTNTAERRMRIHLLFRLLKKFASSKR